MGRTGDLWSMDYHSDQVLRSRRGILYFPGSKRLVIEDGPRRTCPRRERQRHARDPSLGGPKLKVGTVNGRPALHPFYVVKLGE